MTDEEKTKSKHPDAICREVEIRGGIKKYRIEDNGKVISFTCSRPEDAWNHAAECALCEK